MSSNLWAKLAEKSGILHRISIITLTCYCIFIVSGCSPDGDPGSASRSISPLQAPTDVVTQIGDPEGSPQITLSWELPASQNISHIEIDRRESIDIITGLEANDEDSRLQSSALSDWEVIATLSPDATSFSDNGLSCGHNYEYLVCSINNDGGRTCSEPEHVTTPICPPTDLTASLLDGGQVQLTWVDRSSNELWFKIFRKTSGGDQWVQIDGVAANTTTYVDGGVLCGTRYQYKVRAANYYNDSGYSNETSVDTGICPPPVPTELSAVAVSLHEIELVWLDNSSDEVSFSIERGLSADGPFAEIFVTGPDATLYTDSGLDFGTTYFYRIRALNAAGYSGYSNVADATTPMPACSDGIDNDNDALVDYPADPGCASAEDENELGTNQCHDGLDNDGDGMTDWPADTNCSSITDINETNRWYVDIDANGAGTGLSWADAFVHPQQAMDAAVAGETIWVADGTYVKLQGSLTTASVLTMKGGVAIYGGFVGLEDDISQRGAPSGYPTIFDGQGTSDHVVIGASNTVLDGFTITGGYATTGVPIVPWGGGGGGGGMINIYVQNVTVANCIFTNNYAGRNGGGLFNIFTSGIIVRNCSFLQNSVKQTNTAYGGGISDHDGDSVISNCIFDNNSGYYGGGLANGQFRGAIINCVFVNNRAKSGGGIDNYQSSTSIINCTFSGNISSSSGGGLYVRYAGPPYPSPTIVNCILWGNNASSGKNVYSNRSMNITYSDIAEGYTGVGNISTDPLFVAYPDLHLQSGSPCINAGTSNLAPADDFDGNPRPSPVGGAFDMGAYEYQYP